MKDSIYECTASRQALDGFQKTTEEIALFIGRKYKNGSYIRPSIEKLNRPDKIGTRPVMTKMDDGSNSTDEVDVAIFKEDVKAYSLLQREYQAELRKAFNLILGQCSEDMETKIRAHDDYPKVDQSGDNESDPIKLLEIIRSIMCNFQSQRLPELSIISAMTRLFNLHQIEHETVQSFKHRIGNAVEVVYHCGGSIGEYDKLIDASIKKEGLDADKVKSSDEEFKKIKKKCRDKFTGILMLTLANNGRYGKLKNELENNYTKGKNEYPDSFDKSYSMLYYRVEEKKKEMPRKVEEDKDEDDGMIFNTHAGESDLENDGEGHQLVSTKGDQKKKSQRRTTDLSKVQCYKCGKRGHYASSPECPLFNKSSDGESDADDLEDDKEGVVEVNVDLGPDDFPAFNLVSLTHQNWKGSESKPKHIFNDILLDNQANINMFSNPDLLSNIRKGPRQMTVHCQAGSTRTDLIGNY